MMLKIAFNIVGFGMLIGSFYVGIKMLSIGFYLRQKYADLIGKNWNGRITTRQLKKLKTATTDEKSKRLIDDFLKYSRMIWLILIAGILLFLVIGFWNSMLN